MPAVLPRRTLLRGASAAIALPLLEAMLPRRSAAAETSAALPARMAIFYFGTGMNMRQFTPADEGPQFTFSRVLRPLEPFRNEMTVLSGTWLRHGGSHTGDYTFLTGANAHTPSGIKNTLSADQLAARQIGRQTRFPSLQFSVSRGTGFGGNMKTLSWNANGVPLAAESDPRAIFARLFQADDANSAAARHRVQARRGSVLDAVSDQARRLQRRVGQADRQKLAEYFESVRAVEQRLQRDIEWAERPKPQLDEETRRRYGRSYDPERTRDFHYETYARLMYDLVTLALQSDSTRLITYVVRQELRGGVYPEFNVSKGYHELSHHNNDPRNLEELARVDELYMRQWTYLLERMRSIREADGRTLLDRTMLAFSSGMGMSHSPDRLPTALFGGSALGIRHRGHLRLPEKTPLACLWQTMLGRLGVDAGESFQDSTGTIGELVG